MASKQSVHGGRAQTKEFDIDLPAKGIHWAGDPETTGVIISVDTNGILRVEMPISNI
ncbi:hypothetical protein [Halorubrum distributum]|uniref:hypothetical protein n=1 Tax=Halorubrum distributum TaxID=29283 RepID=UPI000AF95768|nr:hypothetical protein [Halorubrum distributum]